MKIITKINPSNGYIKMVAVWAVACFYCDQRFAKTADDGSDFERKILRKGWVESPNGIWHCSKCAAKFAEQP